MAVPAGWSWIHIHYTTIVPPPLPRRQCRSSRPVRWRDFRVVTLCELIVQLGEFGFQAVQLVVMREDDAETTLRCVDLCVDVLGIRSGVGQFVGHTGHESFQSLFESERIESTYLVSVDREAQRGDPTSELSTPDVSAPHRTSRPPHRMRGHRATERSSASS